MLSSITPLGERGRGHSWKVTYTWYLAGSIIGGIVAGTAFAVVGRLFGAPPGFTSTALVSAAIAVIAGVIDLTGRRVPSWQRQVNEDWLSEYRRWIYAGGFGLQLGTGVLTIMTTATVAATWALTAVGGSLAWGALVGAVFGASRALPLLKARSATDPTRLRDLHRTMQRLGPLITRAVVAGCGVLAVAAAGVGVLT